MERSVSGPINVLSERLPGRTKENHETSQSGQSVFRQGFGQVRSITAKVNWIAEYHRSIKLYILKIRSDVFISMYWK
jgi:hypothetical protein